MGTSYQYPLDRRCLPIGVGLLACLALLVAGGCWAPLCSDGIPATCLPEEFRFPYRSSGQPLNFASLSLPPQPDYVLGPGDQLEVTVYGLYPNGPVAPLRADIMANGEIYLPLAGALRVGGMNVLQAQMAITRAYADGIIKDPRVNVYLMAKSTVSVMVIGEVNKPGVYALPKYENDIAHGLAAAGGLAEDAGAVIEVHRRVPRRPMSSAHAAPGGSVATGQAPQKLYPSGDGAARRTRPTAASLEPEGVAPNADSAAPPARRDASDRALQAGYGRPGGDELRGKRPPSSQTVLAQYQPGAGDNQANPFSPETAVPPSTDVLVIPLRGSPSQPLTSADVALQPGDVVVVPTRVNEVFYVVGKLSQTNFVRFSIGVRERDIGAGFVLPRDRDIDVVTAVAMAGYIDPIDSPTTVTVHRFCPDGAPMLIHVDLIKARYDRQENIMVQAGDIIYLNPDAPWWFRRTFDRIVPELLLVPYRKAIGTR